MILVALTGYLTFYRFCRLGLYHLPGFLTNFSQELSNQFSLCRLTEYLAFCRFCLSLYRVRHELLPGAACMMVSSHSHGTSLCIASAGEACEPFPGTSRASPWSLMLVQTHRVSHFISLEPGMHANLCRVPYELLPGA